ESRESGRDPSRVEALRGPSEDVGLWVPELAGKPETPEDLTHLGRLRPARPRIEARSVPANRESPELLDRHKRPHRNALHLAPRAHHLLRPEEEHAASGEDDVVPPVRSRHSAVEDPVGALGARVSDLQTERCHRLLAPALDEGLLAERGGNAERIPGAVREIGDP